MECQSKRQRRGFKSLNNFYVSHYSEVTGQAALLRGVAPKGETGEIITMKSHNSITSLVKPAQAILSHYAQATTKRNHKQRA